PVSVAASIMISMPPGPSPGGESTLRGSGLPSPVSPEIPRRSEPEAMNIAAPYAGKPNLGVWVMLPEPVSRRQFILSNLVRTALNIDSDDLPIVCLLFFRADLLFVDFISTLGDLFNRQTGRLHGHRSAPCRPEVGRIRLSSLYGLSDG